MYPPIHPQPSMTPTERSQFIQRLIDPVERLARLLQEGTTHLAQPDEQQLLDQLPFEPHHVHHVATTTLPRTHPLYTLVGVRYDGVAFTHGVVMTWTDPISKRTFPVYVLTYIDASSTVRFATAPSAALLPARTDQPADRKRWIERVNKADAKRATFEHARTVKEALYATLLPDHEPFKLPTGKSDTIPTS